MHVSPILYSFHWLTVTFVILFLYCFTYHQIPFFGIVSVLYYPCPIVLFVGCLMVFDHIVLHCVIHFESQQGRWAKCFIEMVIIIHSLFSKGRDFNLNPPKVFFVQLSLLPTFLQREDSKLFPFCSLI